MDAYFNTCVSVPIQQKKRNRCNHSKCDQRMDQLCENNMADTTTAQQPSRAPSQGRSALPGLGYKAQHGKESTRPGEPGSADCNGQNLSKKKRNRGKRRRKPKLEDTPLGVTTATADMQTMGLEQVTVTSIPAAMAGDGDVESVSEGIEDLILSDSGKTYSWEGADATGTVYHRFSSRAC